MVTCICDKHNGVRPIVIEGFIYRLILYESLDVAESFVMLQEPAEFNSLASEIWKNCGPFRETKQKLSDVIYEAKKFFDVRWGRQYISSENFVDFCLCRLHSTGWDNMPKEMDFVHKKHWLFDAGTNPCLL
jgi:hypothetical protein